MSWLRCMYIWCESHVTDPAKESWKLETKWVDKGSQSGRL